MLNFDVPNTLPLVLLSVAAVVGGVDMIYYHLYKFKLYKQPSARGEMITHLARDLIMGIGVFIFVRYTPKGGWFYFVGFLLVLDLINSVVDVLMESKSRAPLGGLPRGEYLVHILGTFIVGTITMAYFILFWDFKDQPTTLEALRPDALPTWISLQGHATAAGAFFFALVEGGLYVWSICTTKSARAVQAQAFS
ncbi:MAG: hypothetical protein AB1540_16790 [Bdellovibrionota bacterium]